MERIRVGIVGGAGYTAGELIRLLVNHPYVQIDFVHSESHAGQPISDVHTDLLGDTDIYFSSGINPDPDVLFLCVAHGAEKNYQVKPDTKIIDLSNDFRVAPNNFLGSREFTYGLPELNRNRIAKASNIANPGCFATAIQLALLPLVAASSLEGEIFVSATTGSTGAGQSLSATSHFSWRNGNLSVYKAFSHQHIAEIVGNLGDVFSSGKAELSFIPQRGAFTRGILAALTLHTPIALEQLVCLFEVYYESHPFVHISRKPIDLKQVVNTNKALLYLEKEGDKLLIVSVIDNLLKGASGQAVQNMNILFGLDEMIGLRLKASVY